MLTDIMTCVVEVNEGVGNVKQGIAFLQAQVQHQGATFELGLRTILDAQSASAASAALAAPPPRPAPGTADSAVLSGLVGQLQVADVVQKARASARSSPSFRFIQIPLWAGAPSWLQGFFLPSILLTAKLLLSTNPLGRRRLYVHTRQSWTRSWPVCRGSSRLPPRMPPSSRPHLR